MFNFGLLSSPRSINEPSNNIVLKFLKLESKDLYFINLLYLALYLDLEGNTLVLNNRSTFDYTVYSIYKYKANDIKLGY